MAEQGVNDFKEHQQKLLDLKNQEKLLIIAAGPYQTISARIIYM